MLGPEWWRDKVCIRGADAVAGSVVVERVSDLERGLVVEVFVGEEKDFILEALGNRKPMKGLL